MGTPVQPPSSFFAGDTTKWIVDAPDYLPADGWSLLVNITNQSNTYNKTSTDNGDGRHLITLAVADTTTYVAGDYNMVVAAIKGAERYTIYTGKLTVRPNLATAVDARSHVKKTLDAIEAYMEDPNNLTAASYSIAGRSLSRRTSEEMIALHSHYTKLWKQEKDADRIDSGQGPRRRLLVRAAA